VALIAELSRQALLAFALSARRWRGAHREYTAYSSRSLSRHVQQSLLSLRICALRHLVSSFFVAILVCFRQPPFEAKSIAQIWAFRVQDRQSAREGLRLIGCAHRLERSQDSARLGPSVELRKQALLQGGQQEVNICSASAIAADGASSR